MAALSSIGRFPAPAKVELPANLRTDRRHVDMDERRVFYRARVKRFYSFPVLPQKKGIVGVRSRDLERSLGQGSTQNHY